MQNPTLTRFLTVAVVALAGLAQQLSAEAPVVFRRHALNEQSEFSACAVFDVNQDGKPDVFAGGWWYEAPDWKRHKVRDVELIRGRFDDYANLPLDVNRDGWMDVVSVNYRSRSLYWVEHPGKDWKTDAVWTKHLIDTPGPGETGRLADVDGDGALDILPNGTKYAAWYRLEHDKSNADAKPRWEMHPLPDDVIGHGLGFGDINGDGRGDIVSPKGWLEAPPQPRTDRWHWRPDFRLHRDSGLPILAQDVDGDGDTDLIWGRGHNIGLYWAEQTLVDGKRRWIQHTIDSEWSQAHSLLSADIDGDGEQDLVAGKRYLGHDGKDPAEYDPLPIYWYSFDRQRKTWRRHLISTPDQIGFDLDPKVADLDGDGDQDVIAPSRNGLYWFENQRLKPSPRGQIQKLWEAPRYTHHSQLLVLQNDRGKTAPITNRFQWGQRRQHILAGMQLAMGKLPSPHDRVPLDVKIMDEVKTEKYNRVRLTFQSEGDDRVPAYLLVPHELSQPAPAMLCLHQTTGIGKGEPAALGGRPTLHYAHELANRGYVCLVPDYPSFGDYTYDFRSAGVTSSGSMKAIWNNIRAVDLLESRPEVDGDRIGVIGHSLGGHNALFSAAFDQRLRAVITSCGFTAFHHYYGGKLGGWTSDRYMPRIRTTYHNNPDEVPFDFYEVVAALAPRPLFINAPLHDDNFDVEGVRKVVKEANAVYELTDREDGIQAEYPDSAHDFPDAVRERAYQWLDRQLK